VHILHIPLCVTLIYDSYSTLSLLQQRDGLTVGLLVNHAVTVEGFAAFFVTGKGTDQVRVLDILYILPAKAFLAEWDDSTS
jgi:hypothetical protein